MADTQARIVLSAVDRTKGAFDQARRNLGALQSGASSVLATINPIIGTIGLLGSAISAISFQNIVDGIDALNDIKDATGASIENISALEDVAARTGTSLETVGSALTKFNADLTKAKPGSELAEVFKAIGLNAEELKRLDPAQALLQTAQALAGFADDGNKARIVQELFGKSVREVGAFLKDLSEQQTLNATLSTKQSEEAEKFNKQLFQLQKNLKDAARSIVGELLPAINELLSAFTRARETSSGSFLDGIFGTNPVAKLEKQAELANEAVRRAGDTLDRLAEEQRRKGAGTDAVLDGRIAKARARLEQLQGVAGRASQDLKNLADILDGGPKAPAAAASAPAADKPSIKPPVDPSAAAKAADQALANLRRVVDGNVKAIGAGLADVQDALQFNEQFSRTLYGQGLQSLERFYDDQDRAREDNLAALRQATDEEIAERRRLLESPLLRGPEKAADRREVENQIAEARARLSAAEREAEQSSRLGLLERERAVEALRDQVAGLDAQIRDLATGGTLEGDLLGIAERVRDAQRLFIQGGDSEQDAAARAAGLRRALELQLQFNQARNNFSLITDDAAIAEERLLLAAESGGAGLLETEDRVREVRTAALGKLQDLIAATRELAAQNPQNAPLLQFLQDLELQAERARAVLDPRKLRLDAAAGDAAAALTDGLRQAVTQGGSLRDIINDIGARLNNIALDVILQPFEQGLKNILTGAGGQGFGENIFGKLFGLNAPAGGGVAQAAAGQAAQTTALTAALTTAGATQTAALTTALSATSTAEVAGLSTAIAGTATAQTTAIVAAVTAGSASIVTALAAARASEAGGDVLGDFIKFAGFDAGGYTGNAGTKQAAGVVHGQEFVFSAPAVRRIGVGALEALHNQARRGARRAPLLPGFEGGGYVGLRRASAASGAASPAADAARAEVFNFSPTFVLSAPASRETQAQVAAKALEGAQRARRIR
jgi:hypothetical protein